MFREIFYPTFYLAMRTLKKPGGVTPRRSRGRTFMLQAEGQSWTVVPGGKARRGPSGERQSGCWSGAGAVETDRLDLNSVPILHSSCGPWVQSQDLFAPVYNLKSRNNNSTYLTGSERGLTQLNTGKQHIPSKDSLL